MLTLATGNPCFLAWAVVILSLTFGDHSPLPVGKRHELSKRESPSTSKRTLEMPPLQSH